MKRIHALLLSPVTFVLIARAEPLPAPVFDGLGDHHHPVTTASEQAQRYFDQGLMLCYGFNHAEAIRSFRAAAQLDPGCAMAYWGIAYAYGPHVNKPMSEEDNTRAWAALQEARARQSGASQKEQAYLEALSRRYQAEYAEDRSALDQAYAAGMRRVAQLYPDDLDARTLLAEALMDTMPWDYWTKDLSPKPSAEEAMAALRFVRARDPNHPGANHFYIHLVEAGPEPEQGLPAADRLRGYAPDAGHLVHMPAHIYMRVGQYHDATLANEQAIKADRSYIHHCAAQGYYPGAYYPHNVHFLWSALMFEGQSARALATARKVAAIAAQNYCGPNKAVEAPRFRHLPWLTSARFGRWEEVLQVSEPPATNDFLVDRALWHFARGLALAAQGQPKEAAREYDQLIQLIDSGQAKRLDQPQFPATGLLQVARHWLAGKVAGARGDVPAMVEEMKTAVAAEDALPYMEPAYWPIPTRPALGAALLQAGQPAQAEQVFRDDLTRWPRNGWGLFGLEEALRRQGKNEAADAVGRELARAWQYTDVQLDLAWF